MSDVCVYPRGRPNHALTDMDGFELFFRKQSEMDKGTFIAIQTSSNGGRSGPEREPFTTVNIENLLCCEFLSGTVSGICGIAVGHPLDTIKVRMQISNDKSLRSNLGRTYSREGIYGFYKGLLFPIVSAGVLNAIYFGVFGNSLRHMVQSPRTFCCEQLDQPAVGFHWKVALAGFLGGMATVLVGCPVDCIKTKLQGDRQKRLSPFAIAKGIIQQKGVRGLYCGFLPMMFRDGPGFSAYILTYEHLLCVMEGTLDVNTAHNVAAEMISGGVAGCISWVVAMPFDVVKSRIQFDNPDKPKYTGMVDCFRQSWKSEGPSIFVKGLGVAMIRSFPVNAVTFTVYQFCMRHCKTATWGVT